MDTSLNRSINDLHPIMREAVRALEAKMMTDEMHSHGAGSGFRLFEGYRSPARQRMLLLKHPKVTKARPWQSAHQYGLAADYVWWTGSAWSWDDFHNWDYLKGAAEAVGLTAPIGWDRPHLQHPQFALIRGAFK